ncbi:MAG: FHA domain-containing protein, partial [Gemmataceae bacterium]|nr:FHA domain-containing protein [Gemmataceae bacterium]
RGEGVNGSSRPPALAATAVAPAGHPLTPSPPHPLTPSSATAIPKKFFLWVDGAGGFLVCTGPRVTFGQAAADGPVDVPLYADVSRLHAEVSRDGEGYVVESGKGVLVNGRDATRAVLAPGDRVTLGASCQFLFKRPVSVSATARLDLASGHRLLHPVDAVILMGNDLILGPPGSAAHVAVPDLPEPVGLFRSPEGLGVRVKGQAFRVGDRAVTDRATLTFPAVVSTDHVSFAVEPVGPR